MHTPYKSTAIFLFCLLNLVVSSALAEDNSSKIPIQMAIPPNTNLNLSSTLLNFSLYAIKDGKRVLHPSTIDSVWLNYSSIVEKNKSNTIYVNLASADIPAEISIKLKASYDAGQGNGQVGTPSETIILSEYPQPIITNVGSCFTGLGNQKGHLLVFSWVFNPDYDKEFSLLDENTAISVQVTYTINTNE